MSKVKKGTTNKPKNNNRLVDYKTLERNVYIEVSKEFENNKKEKK